MSQNEFTFWLQGFVELNPDLEAPTPIQWQIIKDHLKLVFNKVTPERWHTDKYTGIKYSDAQQYCNLKIPPEYVFANVEGVDSNYQGSPLYSC